MSSTRQAADSAAEALRITEIAYRAGATSNIEVVQAQQAARNTAIVLAVAEDRLRQSRLDLLVALGLFRNRQRTPQMRSLASGRRCSTHSKSSLLTK